MTVSTEMEGGSRGSRRARRRRWSEEEKRRMVAECEVPGSSVSVVARRHDVNANQLFTWRRQFRKPVEGGEDQAAFVPAIIAPGEPSADREAAAPQGICTGVERRSSRKVSGLMEIVLAGGHRVIVDREVSARALARVLDVLASR